jgi:hypothetical protein
LRVLGWDIGGANVKVAFLETERGLIKNLETDIQYFPIWIKGKEELPFILEKMTMKFGKAKLDAIGVTMTAEVSDIFFSKEEGVNFILDCVEKVFSGIPAYVLGVDGELISIEEAREQPYKVASANWAATGWIVSHFIQNGIIIDVGSTTTSIIPIIDGKIAAEGKNDVEKLANGELVYTGALRTNIATIVHSVPLRGKTVRLSSEKFALSGDIHLVLGNIRQEQYTTETADGRGKSKKEALARIARTVCGDLFLLSESELMEIAKFVYQKQIEQIVDGLRQVYERVSGRVEKLSAIVTGLGKDFLARKASERFPFYQIIDLDNLVKGASLTSPAVAVAFMVIEKLEGIFPCL